MSLIRNISPDTTAFANIQRIAASPEDRVLVIYGSGHAKLLTEFAEDSGAFVVERPSAYLTPKS